MCVPTLPKMFRPVTINFASGCVFLSRCWQDLFRGPLDTATDEIHKLTVSEEDFFPYFMSMGALCCHGNQSSNFNPISPKT